MRYVYLYYIFVYLERIKKKKKKECYYEISFSATMINNTNSNLEYRLKMN